MNLSELVVSANTGADAIKRAPIVEEDTGVKCLRIGDVSQKRSYSQWGNTKTTDMDYNRYKLEINDIIIARTGNTIGVNSFIEDEVQSVYNNGLIRIKADETKVVPRYLWYIVSSKNCQDFVQSIAFGTSTQPNMKINDFLRFSFDYQDLDTQNRIISIIDPIDRKIKANEAINRNLSEQAKAIFNNELLRFNNIPEGWKEASLIDIADYLNGLAMQKFRPSEDEIGIPVLKIKELRQGSWDASSELCSPNIKPEYIIHDGDVIFSWSGSLLVDFWCGGECGLNQHLFKVTSKKYDKWFYYTWTLYHLDRFIAVAADKATTMGHIKRGELAQAEVLIPSTEDYERIGEVLRPIYDMMISNRAANRKLAMLRDEVLPKFMSGELDVSELDV